jgi:Lactonase, 7-bladed beta-propeller
MNSVQPTGAPACVPRFASGERHFLGFEENPMMRHDSQRLRARAFIYVRIWLLAMIFAVALAAPSAVAQTATPQYLFLTTGVPNGQGAFVNGIVTYTVDTTTGALAQITPPPEQTRAVPGALAINNAGTFLFAIATNSAGQGAVESFSVRSDGSLTEIGTSPYTISNPQAAPITIAVSPNGEALYVASSVPFNESTEAPQSTIVDVFAVAANGSLTLSNTFAYSAVQACDDMTPAQLTPIQFLVHPTQKWLYLFMGSSFGPPCSGQPSEVQQSTINLAGTLTSPGAPNILPLYATNGYALTGSPDGTLLFLMTKPNPQNGIIYASGIDQSTGGIGFVLAYSYPLAGAIPILSIGGLSVDSTST